MTGNACCEFLSSILNTTRSAFCPTPDSFPWTISSPRTRGVNTFSLPSEWEVAGPEREPTAPTCHCTHPAPTQASKDRKYHQQITSHFTRPPESSCNQNWQAPKGTNVLWRSFGYFSSSWLYHCIHHSHTFIMVGHMELSAERLNY